MVFPEMRRVSVKPIGVLIRVHFKKSQLGRIVLVRHGVNRQNSGFQAQGRFHFLFHRVGERFQPVRLDPQMRDANGRRFSGLGRARIVEQKSGNQRGDARQDESHQSCFGACFH